MLGSYRRDLDELAAALALVLGPVIRMAWDPDDRQGSAEDLVPVLTDLVQRHRAEAYQRAVRLLRESAAAQGVVDPYIPTPTPYTREAVAAVLRRDLTGDPDQVTARITRSLTQHVESAARQVVVRAVEDGQTITDPRMDTAYDRVPPPRAATPHPTRGERFTPVPGHEDHTISPSGYVRGPGGAQPVAYARVLSGSENCGFCVMMASRGPVYQSRTSAGLVPARTLYGPDAIGVINRYHPGCDCLVVPVYDRRDYPGRESSLAAERLYKIATSGSVSYNSDTEMDARRAEGGVPGPAPGADSNRAVLALDRALYALQRDGKSLPIPDLRAT